MNAAYPLFDFDTEAISPIQIGNGIVVSKNVIEIEKLLSVNLSQEDKHHLLQAKRCLLIDKNKYKPEQASLLFIIACRILKPTKVFIRYRVDYENNTVSKIRDDYPFVPTDDVTTTISNNDFNLVLKLYEGIDTFRKINTRTSNASYFIGLAYRTRKWLEGLLFHVCALETLTSSSNQENGMTKKFVNRINYFIGYEKAALEKIYNVRSELVHGRYLAESNDKNLEYYKIAEEVCRSAFRKILMNHNILDSFNNDEDRMKVFGG
jgi:hypothetical protein